MALSSKISETCEAFGFLFPILLHRLFD